MTTTHYLYEGFLLRGVVEDFPHMWKEGGWRPHRIYKEPHLCRNIDECDGHEKYPEGTLSDWLVIYKTEEEY